MNRNIIKIDIEKCNGCGLCAGICHEGEIEIVNGKAKLLRDGYCDILGNAPPVCPTEAIIFGEYETADINNRAGNQNVLTEQSRVSELRQWPLKIKVIPARASYFDDADLLVAGDCTAYARDNYHVDFMQEKNTIIGCPKLDNVDYSEKLGEIIKQNNIKSVTVIRMEVPCCGGIERALIVAMKNSGKSLPLKVIILGIDGEIKE